MSEEIIAQHIEGDEVITICEFIEDDKQVFVLKHVGNDAIVLEQVFVSRKIAFAAYCAQIAQFYASLYDEPAEFLHLSDMMRGARITSSTS